LVPTVWGFNARWLPAFFGLEMPHGKQLLVALLLAWIGVTGAVSGHALVSAVFLLGAAILSASALRVFGAANRQAAAVRVAYGWLIVSACLTAWAAVADQTGGIWGASRHAVTVGFLGSMVFIIGPRILPPFCGARVLFSKQAALAALILLNTGCFLRVLSEVPAYEGFAHAQLFWHILPISAVTELTAVAIFAANLLITFCRLPGHVIARGQRADKRVFV
jgi:hypothetical protein